MKKIQLNNQFLFASREDLRHANLAKIKRCPVLELDTGLTGVPPGFEAHDSRSHHERCMLFRVEVANKVHDPLCLVSIEIEAPALSESECSYGNDSSTRAIVLKGETVEEPKRIVAEQPPSEDNDVDGLAALAGLSELEATGKSFISSIAKDEYKCEATCLDYTFAKELCLD